MLDLPQCVADVLLFVQHAVVPRIPGQTQAQKPGADYGADPLESIHILTPAEIKAGLDQYVIGQDAAKKVLAVSVYNHYKRILSGQNSDVELQKSNVLMLGPSGTGKDTVVAALLKKHPEIQHTVSATTRAPRDGEKDGINYHFMSVADFEDHLAHDQIVEHTKYCENYYGTLRSEIEGRMKLGIPVILVIEVEGAGNIKKMYPGATTIFVLPPDMAELERRLRCRGTEDEATIQRRLKRAETEIANSVNYDEHVVNIAVDSCADSLYSIIQFRLQHGSDE